MRISFEIPVKGVKGLYTFQSGRFEQSQRVTAAKIEQTFCFSTYLVPRPLNSLTAKVQIVTSESLKVWSVLLGKRPDQHQYYATDRIGEVFDCFLDP